jgi:DNA-binding transcriptional ArsR family regulator
MAKALAEAAPVFAALGDETRLRLVSRLSAGEPVSIARLTDGHPVTRQAISKHLRVLETAGLVHGERRGREQLWSLEARRLEDARAWLDEVSASWDRKLDRLRALVEDA